MNSTYDESRSVEVATVSAGQCLLVYTGVTSEATHLPFDNQHPVGWSSGSLDVGSTGSTQWGYQSSAPSKRLISQSVECQMLDLLQVSNSVPGPKCPAMVIIMIILIICRGHNLSIPLRVPKKNKLELFYKVDLEIKVK